MDLTNGQRSHWQFQISNEISAAILNAEVTKISYTCLYRTCRFDGKRCGYNIFVRSEFRIQQQSPRSPMILLNGPALKINFTVTWRERSKSAAFPSDPRVYIVNELVDLKFLWNTSASKNGEILICKFSSKKHNSEIHRKSDSTVIKMDIISNMFEHSQQGISTPECWSDWQSITKVIEPIVNSKTYCAKCDFYISAYKITTDMMSSKLYTDTDFTDFHLSTDEDSVAVHKACLATRSEVFKAMLSGEWREVKEGKIKLKGVTLQTLQHLKDYLYLSKVPDEGLRPLLLVARSYLIYDLEEHCIRKLAQTATGADLYSLVEFACENNIPELAFATLQLTRSSAVSAAHKIMQT